MSQLLHTRVYLHFERKSISRTLKHSWLQWFLTVLLLTWMSGSLANGKLDDEWVGMEVSENIVSLGELLPNPVRYQHHHHHHHARIPGMAPTESEGYLNALNGSSKEPLHPSRSSVRTSIALWRAFVVMGDDCCYLWCSISMFKLSAPLMLKKHPPLWFESAHPLENSEF